MGEYAGHFSGSVFDKYLTGEASWGEAWNLLVEDVLKVTQGEFTIDPRDGKLIPFAGKFPIDPEVEKKVSDYLTQAQKLLDIRGHRVNEE